MLIKGISGITWMIISGIQWNGINIPFVPKLFWCGMVFQKNVDIFFGMEMNNIEWDGITIPSFHCNWWIFYGMRRN